MHIVLILLVLIIDLFVCVLCTLYVNMRLYLPSSAKHDGVGGVGGGGVDRS